MNKIEKDGKVAVLVSPGYGAGWSTWNCTYAEELCMNAEFVQLVLDGKIHELCELVKERYDYVYTGGADQLKVEWVTKGKTFIIKEYDGSESLQLLDRIEFMVA